MAPSRPGPRPDGAQEEIAPRTVAKIVDAVSWAPRRKRIPAEAVALPDLAIAAIDQHLALLILRDAAGGVDRLALRVVHRCRTAVARTADRPAVPMRDYMLVLAGHEYYLLSRI
jgi:hypothetical protein